MKEVIRSAVAQFQVNTIFHHMFVTDATTGIFETEKWFIQSTKREKTKTTSQRALDRSFYLSCRNGHQEKSLELLDKGATSDYQNRGISALHWACYGGQLITIKAIIKRFPAEMERKTDIKDGFCTPLGYAFKNGHIETAKWLLQMGAQNPIHNAMQKGNDKSFEIIRKTGRALEYIMEDIPRMKELKLLSETGTRDGLEKLMKYYEKEELPFNIILNILLNFKFDNSPNMERTWRENIKHIFLPFPVLEEIQTHMFEKGEDKLSPAVLIEINRLITTGEKLDGKITMQLYSLLRFYKKQTNIINNLIAKFEQIHVYPNGFVAESLNLETQNLVKYVLDFVWREKQDEPILADDTLPKYVHNGEIRIIDKLCKACEDGDTQLVR